MPLNINIFIAWILFSRPSMILLDVAVFYVGCVLATRSLPLDQTIVFASCVFILGRWGILIIDDVIDIEADKINAPHRPIPAGLISIRQATVLGVFHLLLALIFALQVGIQFLLIIVGVIATAKVLAEIFVLLKIPIIPTLGNVFIFGATPLLSWQLYSQLNFSSLLLFLILFSWDWTHDCLGSLRDYKGDKESNTKEFAVVLGKQKTVQLTYVGAVIYVLLTFAIGLENGLIFSQIIGPTLACASIVIFSLVDIKNAIVAKRVRRLWEIQCLIWVIVIILENGIQ